MELRHLRHFVAVAEELHFARAAERLGMEQSPLSHSIRNLEAELKVKLFNRTTRKTWLTRVGSRFYNEVKRILRDIDAAAISLISYDDGNVGSVTLALGEDLASEPFTGLLFELDHHHPRSSIEVRELDHGEAARLVRDGGADVAVTLDGRNEAGLLRRRGWDEPLVLILPLGHNLAERQSVSIREISRERLALPRPETCPGYASQIEGLLKGHDVRAVETINTAHWNTAVSFVSTGRAVALFPSSLASGSTSVAVVAVEEKDAVLTTWLLYSDAELSPAASLVLGLAEMVAVDAGVA